jgi:general secretion pathway protein A
MYDYFFQLSCRPFDLAPDPKFLFMTGQHARAAANVRFALMNHDSFVVITGEIGTGKTTVLNSALRALGSQYVAARLIHTTLTDVELLQALLSEFGISNYSTKKVKLLDELRAFFLEQHLAGRHVVIIVDEAQHLNPAALEELRLLSCIDSQDRRIVSIVLMGQPALDDVLDDASLAQLRQRTRLRQRLRPMDENETAAYIRHRLKLAGGNADAIFAPDTYPEIYRLTLGIPRLINTLCDTTLTACMVDSRQRADLETIAGVVKELGWRWAEAEGRRKKDPDELKAGPPRAGTRAYLDLYSDGKVLQRNEIRSVPFSIGRTPGNGLIIDEQGVSRRHALVDRVDGQYVIEDLNSLNGVLINGKQRETALLKSGDIVTIGRARLVFVLRGDPQDDQEEDTGEYVSHGTASSILFAETQTIPRDSEALEPFAKGKAG